MRKISTKYVDTGSGLVTSFGLGFIMLLSHLKHAVIRKRIFKTKSLTTQLT